MTILSQTHQLLHTATCPEDVFGFLAAPLAETLRQRYRELAAIVHPDRNLVETAEATAAFQRLQEWLAEAEARIAQGFYGKTPTLDITSADNRYMGYGTPLSGDLCDLYPATDSRRPLLLKVVRHPRNNDLMDREARTLQAIHRSLAGETIAAHFPTLADHLTLRDERGVQRRVNVLCREAGTVSLAQVLAAYPQGIHPADAAWMFNRLLAALAITHDLGWIHGGVIPEHLLLRLSDHNGLLIDWCYAVEIGDTVPAMSLARRAFYAPEILARQPVRPATDLYMAGQCMVALLGGDVTTGHLPDSAPPAIQALLRTVILPSPTYRAGNAWALFEDFQRILATLYGPPRFRPFELVDSLIG